MRLLRAAFETKDSNVVWMLVLCAGCYQGLLQQLASDPLRRWTREYSGSGMCEFCLEDVRRAAVE